MIRTLLDWLLTINLILLLGFFAYLWWTDSVALQIGNPAAFDQTVVVIDDQTRGLFITTLRDEVDSQLGQPIEGYTPDMFISVFPGLVATDFEDVAASIGKYVVVEGQLVHVTPPGTPLHGAASAVSSQGLSTLLENVATRAQIDLSRSGTITDIMRVISEE